MQLLTQLSPRVYLYTGETRPAEILESALALRHLPGAAFGDGSHPTTRMCAGAVDLLCRLAPVRNFLDVGTGTGVLARIARAHGAELIAATDIDPVAIESAKAHAALDLSAVEIQIGDFPPDHWGARFDLVVANILEAPLRTLARELAAALAPSGTLLMSGFTPLQIPALKTSFTQVGLKMVSEAAMDGWALLTFRRGAQSAK